MLERAGTALAPCVNRRDAFHLLRAGLSGDDAKNIPTTVTDRPRVFLTSTAH